MGSANPDRLSGGATATADEVSGEVPGGDTGDRSAEDATTRGHRRRLAAVAAVVLAAIVVAAIVVLDAGSSPRASPSSGVPAGQTTAEVTRRTLSESSTVDGTLGYGSTLELYDRVAGTFTWLPAVGAVIHRGGTLWRVNNEPVALMYGSVPAYRKLEEGVSDGPDVTELNENLIDLGFDPYGAITDEEDFNEGTAAAVRRWQHAAGLRETGEVELGRVVFAPGARRVTAVKVALGQDPPGSTSPSSDEPAPKKPAAKKSEPKKSGAKEPASNKDEPASKAPASEEEPASKRSLLERTGRRRS